jgi:hypothetical protein
MQLAVLPQTIIVSSFNTYTFYTFGKSIAKLRVKLRVKLIEKYIAKYNKKLRAKFYRKIKYNKIT